MGRILVSICFALVLVSTSYGTVDPISNWEATNKPDGWKICTWGTQGDTTLTFGATVGVTLGVGSAGTVKTMNHLDTGGKTWGWNIAYASYNSGGTGGTTSTVFKSEFWDAIAADKYLMIDITYDPVSMTSIAGDKFFNSHLYLQVGATGTLGQVNVQWENLAAWDGLSKQTFHVSLPTTAVKDGLEAIISGPTQISWVQLMVGWQAGPGWDGKGTVYYDDFKLATIPEPATMTLLGLGALALIRRKR